MLSNPPRHDRRSRSPALAPRTSLGPARSRIAPTAPAAALSLLAPARSPRSGRKTAGRSPAILRNLALGRSPAGLMVRRGKPSRSGQAPSRLNGAGMEGSSRAIRKSSAPARSQTGQMGPRAGRSPLAVARFARISPEERAAEMPVIHAINLADDFAVFIGPSGDPRGHTHAF
jgi:hypothetical protein